MTKKTPEILTFKNTFWQTKFPFATNSSQNYSEDDKQKIKILIRFHT